MIKEGVSMETVRDRLVQRGVEKERWRVCSAGFALVGRRNEGGEAIKKRAIYISKKKILEIARINTNAGKRTRKREARKIAEQILNPIRDMDGGGGTAEEAWQIEWMKSIEGAKDALDKIRSGRQATEKEWEDMRTIMSAELTKPTAVGRSGRMKLVAALGEVQVAACNMREGWEEGTRWQRYRAKEVQTGREKLKLILRMWWATTSEQQCKNEWKECTCANEKTCVCRWVTVHDILWEWRWMRAWAWTTGRKKGTKKETWINGKGEGRSFCKNKGVWKAIGWEWQDGKIIESDVPDRDWRQPWRQQRQDEWKIRKEAEKVVPVPKNTSTRTNKGGIVEGRMKWQGHEFSAFCKEVGVKIWEGVWRRVGERVLPARGDG
jgi:hypothetical protein